MATPELSPENSKKKPSLAQVLIPVAAIVATAGTAAYFLKTHGGDSEVSETVVAGKRISDLNFHTLKGDAKKLSEIKGKVILINFWATWCGPCIREMPSLDRLYREYKTRGLEVVAVSVDDEPENRVPKFFEKLGVSFESYVDRGGKLSEQIGVEGLPYTLIVDSDRKVLFGHLGDDDWFSHENRQQIEKWLGVDGA